MIFLYIMLGAIIGWWVLIYGADFKNDWEDMKRLQKEFDKKLLDIADKMMKFPDMKTCDRCGYIQEKDKMKEISYFYYGFYMTPMVKKHYYCTNAEENLYYTKQDDIEVDVHGKKNR